MKLVKENAEAQKREVTNQEIKDAKEKISLEAKDKYYALDIATAVLTYQKSELIRKDGPNINPNNKNSNLAFAKYALDIGDFEKAYEYIMKIENSDGDRCVGTLKLYFYELNNGNDQDASRYYSNLESCGKYQKLFNISIKQNIKWF